MPTDIDTTQVPDVPEITDLKGLSDTIYELAKEQLRINAAETKMQDAVEDAKVKYEAAIKPHATRLQTLFAAVANYAATAIDLLFPAGKNGVRKKTYKVLGHDLQLRKSTALRAPEEAVEKMVATLKELRVKSFQSSLTDAEEADLALLKSLLRQPPIEIVKEAAKAALQNPDTAARLATWGLTAETSDTFKVAFKFTPDSQP